MTTTPASFLTILTAITLAFLAGYLMAPNEPVERIIIDTSWQSAAEQWQDNTFRCLRQLNDAANTLPFDEG